MVQLTQGFMIYICVAFVKGHIFFGNDHHRVHHDISDLPQMISHLINQNLGHRYPHHHNHGMYRPGMSESSNFNLGTPFNYNRPSNIFTGNLFGSPDYTSQEGMYSSDESGEPSQQPNSGEELPNIQIPQVPSISDGINGVILDGIQDGTGNIFGGSDEPNGQNVDLPGQEIVGNVNVDIPNIQIPQVEGIDKIPVNEISTSASGDPAQDGTNANLNNPGAAINTVGPVLGQLGQVGLQSSTGINDNIQGTNKTPVNGIISSALGGQAQDNSNADVSNPGAAINAVGTVMGQLEQVGLPSSAGVSENIEGNKHNIDSDVPTSSQDNVKVNLNSSSDFMNDTNLHVNAPIDINKQTPGVEIATDSKLDDIIKDIFKPDDQTNLNAGIDKPKVSVSGIPSQNTSNLEGQIPYTSTNKDENLGQNTITENLPTDKSTSIVKDDSAQNGTLKTNLFLQPPNNTDNSDILISKHKDRSSIVFPDQLNETKAQIQKEKNESQLSKLNDSNGQFLYAVNIGPAIVPTNQGFYVPPTSTDNVQKAYVNSPSSTPVQYVPQNPSNILSNTLPSSNVVPTNANGGSQSGGYTLVNYPTNGNSNSGQASYNIPTSTGGQSNGYYQVSKNPSQQAYYTVQLGNGQTALVPVSSGQYVQSNGQGQMMPSNSQQYVLSNGQPVQSTGQVLYSNGQQFVPSTGQLMQGNGQMVMSSNGQHYIPSNSQFMQGNGQFVMSNNDQQFVPSNIQPLQGNGQIVMSSNGQQYVPNNGQTMQGNQVIMASNGQQYIPTSSQPMQGNGPILVSSNGQQYVQSNGQLGTGQFVVSNNGQNYLPSGQVSMPWGQGTVQNNGQVYIPINQIPQNNVITVPAGSIVTVGSSSNSVPLMVFKDKDESPPKPTSDEERDGELVQEKDEVKDEIADKTDDDKQSES